MMLSTTPLMLITTEFRPLTNGSNLRGRQDFHLGFRLRLSGGSAHTSARSSPRTKHPQGASGGRESHAEKGKAAAAGLCGSVNVIGLVGRVGTICQPVR